MTSPSTSPSTAASLTSGLLNGGGGAGHTLAMGSSMSGFISVPNIGQMVTVKLARDTHLLWKAQVVPILRGHQLLGYADGTIAAPAKLVPVSNEDGAEQITNPAYTTWYTQDQLILSAILSTLSPEVLARVLGLATSATVWAALERMFASQSRTRVTHLRRQLTMLQKKDQNVTDYFARAKAISDQLAAAGSAIEDSELITHMLTGLDQSYEAFVTSINFKGDELTADEFYSHLLDHEAFRDANNLHYQIQANMAGRGNGNGGRQGERRGNGNGGRQGGRGNQQGNGGRNQGNFRPPKGGGGGSGGRGRNHQGGGGTGNSGGDRPVCQICNQPGHLAFRCYDRYNHNVQPEEPRFINNISSGQQQFEPVWYADSGATDHVTADLDKLHVREQYTGKDQVHTASGAGSGFEEGSCSRTL